MKFNIGDWLYAGLILGVLYYVWITVTSKD